MWMPDLIVAPVASRREKKQFLEFPWKLYRDDPNWVPPIRVDQKELVNYRPHPFYERNAVETFLALRGGEVVGRIAAIHNRIHNEHHHDKIGFFGFFESIDDQEVASRLFDAARAWLAERGLETLRGPMNPGINYTLGTLIEGFDSPPTFMMTYNPAYYPRLLEGYGFRKAQDLYSYYGYKDMLPASTERLAPIAEQIVERFNVKTRTLDRSKFLADVELFLRIFNESLRKLWSFSPMTPGEVRHIAKSLRWLIVPELTAAVEIDGKTVGASFGILDYNPRIKRIDGRLFPFGFLRLLWNRRAIKRMRLISTNVLPEYQLMGIGLVLLRDMLPRGLTYGALEEVEYSWVMESNALSRGSLEKGGAKRLKTFRIYDYP
jgi:GNAT superfamily N-acetyltransferase